MVKKIAAVAGGVWPSRKSPSAVSRRGTHEGRALANQARLTVFNLVMTARLKSVTAYHRRCKVSRWNQAASDKQDGA